MAMQSVPCICFLLLHITIVSSSLFPIINLDLGGANNGGRNANRNGVLPSSSLGAGSFNLGNGPTDAQTQIALLQKELELLKKQQQEYELIKQQQQQLDAINQQLQQILLQKKTPGGMFSNQGNRGFFNPKLTPIGSAVDSVLPQGNLLYPVADNTRNMADATYAFNRQVLKPMTSNLAKTGTDLIFGTAAALTKPIGMDKIFTSGQELALKANSQAFDNINEAGHQIGHATADVIEKTAKVGDEARAGVRKMADDGTAIAQKNLDDSQDLINQGLETGLDNLQDGLETAQANVNKIQKAAQDNANGIKKAGEKAVKDVQNAAENVASGVKKAGEAGAQKMVDDAKKVAQQAEKVASSVTAPHLDNNSQ